MIIFIILLILLSFIQSSLLRIDLLAIVLLSRSLLVEDNTNYYLAFGLGLLVSFLQNMDLGLLSIFYLILVKLTYLIKRVPFSTKWFFILPLALLLTLVQQLLFLIMGTSIDWMSLSIQTLSVIVIYPLIKIWVERIEVKSKSSLVFKKDY